MSPSLELLTTETLIAELMSRYDHAVFHGIKDRPLPENPGNAVKSWNYKGRADNCLGLAVSMLMRLQRVIEDAEHVIPNEDI